MAERSPALRLTPPEIDDKVTLRDYAGMSRDCPEAHKPVNIEGIVVLAGEAGDLGNSEPLGYVAATCPAWAVS